MQYCTNLFVKGTSLLDDFFKEMKVTQFDLYVWPYFIFSRVEFWRKHIVQFLDYVLMVGRFIVVELSLKYVIQFPRQKGSNELEGSLSTDCNQIW